MRAQAVIWCVGFLFERPETREVMNGRASDFFGLPISKHNLASTIKAASAYKPKVQLAPRYRP
jgi:hypothetical protein